MIKRILLVIVMVAYLAVSIFAAYVGISRIIDRYSVEDEIISFYEEGRINLVIEDELVITSAPPIINGSEIMLPFDVVKEYIDPTIFRESDGSVVTVTSADKVIRMDSEELQSYVNMESVEIDMSARFIDRVLYVPIVVFSEIFGIEAEYLEEHDVVIIDFLRNFEHTGIVSPVVSINYDEKDGTKTERTEQVLDEVPVRSGKSVKDPVYKAIGPEGEAVDVYEIDGDWSRIRTEEGIVGYVETRFLNSSVDYKSVQIDLVRSVPGVPEKIVLAWQYIYKTTPPAEDFEAFDSINVYSPTWFTVTDSDGTMESRADMPYVERVHEEGALIWPLLNNTFNDIDMTSAVLNNPDARDNIIRQLLSYAQLYDLDGINFDFENIYLKDKDSYTQLFRELMPYARDMDIKVSIAVGIPGGSETYSLCYDHEKLAEEADYLMLMSYDQHWASSPVAGSQAQLPWVSDMIELTLENVAPEKLLVGIPFYTRMWRDTDGVVKNFKTLGIDDTMEYLEEKGAEMAWDEESGQYFATFTEEGSIYKMWIEEPESIGLKAGLVNEYGLAGAAVWQLSLGNEEAWKSIGEALSER